ncbi:MAG: redoxin domain-containing protein [Candidatus Levybacteria bacterium]|nr:redoxin domain-containing protein [Candidatus Levybacteria bacterium]
MRNKEWLFITLATFATVGVIFVVTFFLAKDTPKPNTSTSDVKQQSVLSNDDMSSHHAPASPSDSTAFNSLVGKTAPDFTLEDYTGKAVTLSSLKGKKVLLFFNEGIMCYPSCWNQIAAFGSATEFDNETIILNIVVDPKKDWQQAISKMPQLAKATVLFDSNATVSNQYGVLNLPSSMHRGQYPGHSYVIIDKEGIIRFTMDDEKMAVRNKELAEEMNKL